jgi:hypothetical protein
MKSSFCQGIDHCVDVEFVTSSYCALSSCVEVGYRKSSFCGHPGCVEVDLADDGGNILVRDSKLGDGGGALSFTKDEWTAFIKGVKAGEFDLEESA